MNQFFLDKSNKVPLYLQLKDQIKYYISTGAMKSRERLPPVKVLAKTLGINFLTVRKAYKELEQERLVTIKHGDGCFITLHQTVTDNQAKLRGQNKISAKGDLTATFTDEIKKLIERFLQEGLEIEKAQEAVGKIFLEFEQSQSSPIVVFTECNQFQIKQISEFLGQELKLEVKPMLLQALKAELPQLIEKNRKTNVVTTGFHVNEVREAVGELPIQIDVLITNLNPETRRQLETAGEKAKYSFICRDQESTVLYKDLLKAELGYQQIHLTSCTLSETEKVQSILNSSDVILVSPPVYEEVRKLAPPERAVYNLFERVDPMSLKVVKDRILKDNKFLGNFMNESSN